VVGADGFAMGGTGSGGLGVFGAVRNGYGCSRGWPWMHRHGLCATPDEVQPNPVLHGAEMSISPQNVPASRAA